jgi:hypothetical protein
MIHGFWLIVFHFIIFGRSHDDFALQPIYILRDCQRSNNYEPISPGISPQSEIVITNMISFADICQRTEIQPKRTTQFGSYSLMEGTGNEEDEDDEAGVGRANEKENAEEDDDEEDEDDEKG